MGHERECWCLQLVPGDLPAFLEPVRRQLLLAGLQMRVLRRLPPAAAAAALVDGWAASAAAEAAQAAAVASEQAAALGEPARESGKEYAAMVV